MGKDLTKRKRAKHASEWTFQDLQDYMNYRACDGNWSMFTAMAFLEFYNTRPNPIFSRKKKLEKWFQEHKGEILNLEDDPIYDIETGEFVSEESNH